MIERSMYVQSNAIHECLFTGYYPLTSDPFPVTQPRNLCETTYGTHIWRCTCAHCGNNRER